MGKDRARPLARSLSAEVLGSGGDGKGKWARMEGGRYVVHASNHQIDPLGAMTATPWSHSTQGGPCWRWLRVATPEERECRAKMQDLRGHNLRRERAGVRRRLEIRALDKVQRGIERHPLRSRGHGKAIGLALAMPGELVGIEIAAVGMVGEITLRAAAQIAAGDRRDAHQAGRIIDREIHVAGL